MLRTSYIVVALLVGGAALAATWDGAGDMEWTQPDSTSWSGGTYSSGNTATFAGAGVGTVSVVGTVTPGKIDFNSTGYTLDGGTIAGSGGVNLNSIGTVTLSGSNTYSGVTLLNSAKYLVFKGRYGLSSNTIVRMKGEGSAGIKIHMDDAGTVSLNSEIEMDFSQAIGNSTYFYEINVNNAGGATTDTTIDVGKADFAYSTAEGPSRLIQATGANGYRLQFTDADLSRKATFSLNHGPQGFYPVSAPITVAGTIKQVNGGTGISTARQLYLGGTLNGKTNYVTGLIKDANDYDDNSNSNALPLKVRINSSSYAGQDAIWAFTSPNAYTGPTYLQGGVLVIDNGAASETLPDSGALYINSPGVVHLPEGVREAVGSLYFEGALQNSGSWGSTSSGANNTTNTYFSGSGRLFVGVPLPALSTVIVVR